MKILLIIVVIIFIVVLLFASWEVKKAEDEPNEYEKEFMKYQNKWDNE